ncbi:MAG: dienelactone hydrolase family protein [Alphaproteobacteria bacterium]|nr:dienelactone hydrolase family protein [Alphaproteobacteria bacterium]
MKRVGKILLGLVAALALVGAGLFTWMVLKPHPPAEVVDAGPTGRRVQQGDLFGNYFPASGKGRRPAVLLLGGSEGGLFHDVKRLALVLQAAGFNVLQIGYFNVPGKPSKLEWVPLEQFYHGLDWLKAQPEVDAGALAVIGGSKGAEAALLVATRRPDVKAVVAGMPSSVAWDGLSARSYLFGGVSSWSEGGKGLASLAYGKAGKDPKDLMPRFQNALATLPQHQAAAIPVERAGGPVLLICGEKDTLWPSCPMARAVLARAQKAGRPQVQLLAYPEAGHGVLGAPLAADSIDMKTWSRLGGSPAANAAARADAWPRMLAFLHRALGS